jgi:hypothetical protein
VQWLSIADINHGCCTCCSDDARRAPSACAIAWCNLIHCQTFLGILRPRKCRCHVNAVPSSSGLLLLVRLLCITAIAPNAVNSPGLRMAPLPYFLPSSCRPIFLLVYTLGEQIVEVHWTVTSAKPVDQESCMQRGRAST